MTRSPGWKLIWVTGASQGMGRALCLALARDGYTVAATARNEQSLGSLAEESVSMPGNIHSFPADLTHAGENQRVITEIHQQLGSIDLAVLNAGTHRPTPAADFRAADVKDLIDLNLMAAVHAIEALLPGMLDRNSGHIAAVASIAGYRGLPTAAGYGASKAALIHLCEALKLDLSDTNLRIQVINPGFVKTPLTDRNPFPMPFLVSTKVAADAIIKGLRKNHFEIKFPWLFTNILKTLRLLPYRIYFPWVKQFTQPET
jgi:short-subunit dehydrogenase